MGAPLNNKNEQLDDYNSFYTTKNWKDFDLWGTDGDNHVVLDSIYSDATDGYKNINLLYYGDDGVDTLEYDGTMNRVEVTLSDKAGFDLYFDGGHSTSDGLHNLESLEVWTQDVEIFDLTNNGDEVDLTNATKQWDFTFYGGGGRDDFFGSAYDDVFFGEASDDNLYGYGGNDFLDGGSGHDYIDGGIGNDIINAGTGSDTVFGSKGNDIIFASADLDSDGINTVYGDWYYDVTDDEYRARNNHFNEKDMFVVGYDTTVSIDGNGEGEDIFSTDSPNDFALVASALGSAAVGAAGFGNFTIAAGSLGITFGTRLISTLIGGGANAEAAEMEADNFDNQVYIGDFDAWTDVAVIALDEYEHLVSADVTTSTVGGIADFDIGGTEFLNLELATEQLSIMENETYDFADLSAHKADILGNLILNSMVISSDTTVAMVYDGAYPTGYEWTTTVSARDIFGNEIVLTEEDEATLEGLMGTASSDGVWVFGDFGNSILFGNDLSALAGTNSDNMMYSGRQLDNTANWFSDTSITMYAGQGHDAVFGSTASSDELYGGEGDDYLHGMGIDDADVDYLFGGAGSDTASFSKVTSNNDIELTEDHGIYVDLSDVQTTTGGDSYVHVMTMTGTQVAAYKSDASLPADADWDPVAYLDSIENIEGTAYDDVLIGDSGDNVLRGGEGWDILTGGGGSDTFIFDGAETTSDVEVKERILDFGTDDVIVLVGSTASSFTALEIKDKSNAGNTVIDYGNGSIKLMGFDADDLSSDHIVFVDDLSLV